jgi:hypothetical protein
MGENLRVVWAEFSTLGLAVLQNVYNPWPVQIRPSLDLKTRPRFNPVSLRLSMIVFNVCREEGSLLSFVYKFGQLARQCC